MAEIAPKSRAPRKRAAKKKGGVQAETVEFTFNHYKGGAFGHEELGLSAGDLRETYRSMALQRRFEERAAQMYGKQKIAGFLHLYIGQEAVSTGTVNALNVGGDSVITAYRDHGIGLALGMTPDECMAELFGKVGGSSRGKGGSMHYFKKEVGMFGGHGIVGAHVPVGIGIAFAHQYKEDGGVCVVFLGDGAVGQGIGPRSAQPGVALQIAGRRGDREQQLRDGHLDRARVRPARVSAVLPSATTSLRRSSTGWTC